MFFAEVTPLMRQGLRLKVGERAPPMLVTVTILESDRDKNNSARNLVEASLYVSYGTAQTVDHGSALNRGPETWTQFSKKQCALLRFTEDRDDRNRGTH